MKIKKLLAGFLAAGIFAVSYDCFSGVSAAEETAAASSGITTNSIAGWPQGPEITSTAAVIMEDSTNTVLYAKNADQQLYPGGTVKVMTTLLALENTPAYRSGHHDGHRSFRRNGRRSEYFRPAGRGIYH